MANDEFHFLEDLLLILSLISVDYLLCFVIFCCILFFIILGKLRINSRVTLATQIVRGECAHVHPCFLSLSEEEEG